MVGLGSYRIKYIEGHEEALAFILAIFDKLRDFFDLVWPSSNIPKWAQSRRDPPETLIPKRSSTAVRIR
jgi:hypothetical protein